MPEKWLITGGSGFIGTEVVTLALARGHDVCNIDIKAPRLDAHRPFWTEIDIRDRDAFIAKVRDYAPDRILHLASDIDISIPALASFTTTIEGTRNVADAAASVDGLKRLVHTSTQFVVTPGVEPRDEHFYEPYTVYGEAKAESEKIIWASELKAPWTIVRPTIIWGPHHPSFATEIFKHIRRRTYLQPKGPQPIMRAFGYVGNTAEQMVILAETPAHKLNRHVFYLGDASIDYDQWADAFALGLTGRKARRIPLGLLTLLGKAGDLAKKIGVPSPIDSGRAFRMSTSSKIDLEATHAVTGAPTVSFDAGVTNTMDWLSAYYSTP